MKKAMTTKARQAKAVAVLKNGPWPVDAAGLIFDHDLTARGESNAHRTFHSLIDGGRVVIFVDPATGRRNYALKGDRWIP